MHSQKVPTEIKSLETEGKMGRRQGLGEGDGESVFNQTEIQFGKMRKFWRYLPNNVNVLNATELCTLKWLR